MRLMHFMFCICKKTGTSFDEQAYLAFTMFFTRTTNPCLILQHCVIFLFWWTQWYKSAPPPHKKKEKVKKINQLALNKQTNEQLEMKFTVKLLQGTDEATSVPDCW